MSWFLGHLYLEIYVFWSWIWSFTISWQLVSKVWTFTSLWKLWEQWSSLITPPPLRRSSWQIRHKLSASLYKSNQHTNQHYKHAIPFLCSCALVSKSLCDCITYGNHSQFYTLQKQNHIVPTRDMTLRVLNRAFLSRGSCTSGMVGMACGRRSHTLLLVSSLLETWLEREHGLASPLWSQWLRYAGLGLVVAVCRRLRCIAFSWAWKICMHA